MEARKLPSGSWRCLVFSHIEEIRQPDGSIKEKRIYKSFTCQDPSKKGKRACEQMAAEWAIDKEHREKEEANITFGEALERHIRSKDAVLSPATMRGYLSNQRKLLNEFPDFCNKKMCDLSEEDVQDVVNQLATGTMSQKALSPKSIRNIYGLISSVFHQFNPRCYLDVTLPKKVRPDLYIPSDEEVKLLVECTRGTEMELPIMLAAFGPMRRGEICALNTRNISGNIVHVCENMVMDKNGQWIIKTPKSYAGDRFIEYPDFVAENWAGINGRITELTPAGISSRFSRLLDHNGLPHFRFHDLRHYSASVQHALGIPDAYIMQRAGWENDNVLKGIYRHTLSDRAAKMKNITNEYFSELCNTKCNTK